MINIICLALIINTSDIFLPQWMTPEEQLRTNEIGQNYYPLPPPQGWVETPGEFEPLRAVFVTWIYSQSTYRPIFREIVREVAEVCKCYIIASSSESTSIKSYLTSGGVPMDSVIFYVWPYKFNLDSGLWSLVYAKTRQYRRNG